MMKHYINSNNEIYAYEADGSQDDLIAEGMVLITEQQADAIRNPPQTLDELRHVKWSHIKSERDRRKAGGVKVGTKWFHSDDSSRIQQIALVMFGVSVPPVQWKTMDGTSIAMSQTLASGIFQATAAADQVNFSNAEAHRIALNAAESPADYDYASGWMPIYES